MNFLKACMTKMLLDANVLIFFNDPNSVFHSEVVLLLQQLRELNNSFVITPAILNEVHYFYLRRDGHSVAKLAVETLLSVPGFLLEDILLDELAIKELSAISEKNTMATFDATHVLYCKKLGIKKIVSYDKRFDRVKGMERIYQL